MTVDDFLDEVIRERTGANPAFPTLVAAAEQRRAVVQELSARRTALGLSQTEVAARMRTSQPVVARIESGNLDSRISTLERYAAALGMQLELRVRVAGTSRAAR